MNISRKQVIGWLIVLCNVYATNAALRCDSSYVIGMSVGYGYNETNLHYGGFAISADIPVSAHFVGSAAIHALTVNSYDFGIHLYPKFPLPVGGLFFDVHLLNNLLIAHKMYVLCGGLSLGYAMDYVEISVGYGLRMTSMFDMSRRSVENCIFEPHNLLYHAEVFVRPGYSRWNLSACVTNVNDYQQERMFTPVFSLTGYVAFDKNWHLKMELSCKPVGISNLIPSFYGAAGRIIVEYHFK